jgi:diguanylate cyclase (GGDEF)-like protein/PAS domain S-box-containing protein
MVSLAPRQNPDASPPFVRSRLHGAVRGIIASMFLPASTHVIEIDIGRTLAELYAPSIESAHLVRTALVDAMTTDLPAPMLPLVQDRLNRTLTDVLWGIARNGMVARTPADPASAPSTRDRLTGSADGSDGTPVIDAAWCRTFAAYYPGTVLISDIESGDLVAASPHVEGLLGYTVEEFDQLTDETLMSPDSPDDDYDQGIDLLAGRIDLVERMARFIRKDGQVISVDLRFWVMGKPGSSPRYMFTEMRPTGSDETVWLESDRRFRHLAQLTHDALVIVDGKGRVRYANPGTERALGIVPEHATGMSLIDLALPDDRCVVESFIRDLRDGPPRATGRVEVRLQRQDGLWRWFELTGTNLLDVTGMNGLTIQAREISAHKELAALLEEQAVLDPLTGIRNRRGIHQRLDQEIARFVRTGESAAVMYIDLDGFKAINDHFGHTVGDDFLVEIGRRLVNVLDPDSLAGRVGGDEFVVIMPSATLSRALDVAERIIAALVAPFPYEGESLTIGCGLGLVMLEHPDHTVASLLAAADAALYRAKARRDGHPEIGRDEPAPLVSPTGQDGMP